MNIQEELTVHSSEENFKNYERREDNIYKQSLVWILC